jgi:hypothetical protein
MPPRPRPWQIVLSCVAADEWATSRSFFTEREAVEAAIAWCGVQDRAKRPIASVHNCETSSGKHMVSDEVDPMRLASQSYRVQNNRDCTLLLLGTWPAMTASETDAHLRWAIHQRGPEPKGSARWRPAAEVSEGG